MSDRLRPIVGIMGSHENEWNDYAEPAGRLVARLGFHLLTGGGKGVMTAASRAFCRTPERKGLCLGIIPTDPTPEGSFAPCPDYPNDWVEVPIYTPLPKKDEPDRVSRNYVNIMTSNVVIALPGSSGTKHEVELAVKFKKPLILFGPAEQFSAFPPKLNHTDNIDQIERFLRP